MLYEFAPQSFRVLQITPKKKIIKNQNGIMEEHFF
jgi:hypothetical protein